MRKDTMRSDKTVSAGPFKVAFIGTGGRGVAYAREYAGLDEIQTVALADPSVKNRRTMVERSGLSGDFAEYDDWRGVLDNHSDLDGVVICTPNHLHAEHAIPFLERGLPVALEKPLATTKGDCERILDAESANGGRTLIGFVLRSSPFYSKIHELVRGGVIGEVCAIEAHEHVRWIVTSLIMRGSWRRYQRTSGGSLLEKTCHDLDILNWLVGCRPISVNSYGGRRMLNPNAALPASCEGCKVAEDCNYYHTPLDDEREDEQDKTLHRFLEDVGDCIYNIEKDVADVQSVNIEYENGAVANFLMAFNVSGGRGSRNINVIGQKGCIWGDVDDLSVTLYENRTDKQTEFPCVSDGSGHGGADHGHAMEFVRMMRDPTYRPDQDARAGYLSAVTAFGCEISRQERHRVNLRYDADGRVDFA